MSVSSIRREVVLDSGPQLEGRFHRRRPQVLVGSRQRQSGLAQTGDHRCRRSLYHPWLGTWVQNAAQHHRPAIPSRGDRVETDYLPGAKLLRRRSSRPRSSPAASRTPIPASPSARSAGSSREAAGQGGNRPTYFTPMPTAGFVLILRQANASPSSPFRPPASFTSASPRESIGPRALSRIDRPGLIAGVAIRGTVVEEGSGQRVAGALVNFRSYSPPAGTNPAGGFAQSVTADDGSFAFAVAPRAGHLVVLASNEEYVLREFGSRELSAGQPGGDGACIPTTSLRANRGREDLT